MLFSAFIMHVLLACFSKMKKRISPCFVTIDLNDIKILFYPENINNIKIREMHRKEEKEGCRVREQTYLYMKTSIGLAATHIHEDLDVNLFE